MNKDKAYEILLKLLEIEQNRINNLDSTKFTIKGLSITLVSALVGFAFDKKNQVFIYVAIFATIFCSSVDFIYRKVQLGHVEKASSLYNCLKTEYFDSIDFSSQTTKIFSEYKKDFIKDYSPQFLLYIPMIFVLILLLGFVPTA